MLDAMPKQPKNLNLPSNSCKQVQAVGLIHQLPILGKMFRYLGRSVKSSPVVCHLDHGYSKEECVEGIDSGFTSSDV